MLLPFQGSIPSCDPSAFVAENAILVGDVTVGPQSSLWYNVVVRGDLNFIRIGSKTNIQDGAVIHVGRDDHPVIVGDEVTIGHNVTLHGCRIGDRCLIGIGAILLDGVEVGSDSLVAAGSLLSPGTIVPPRSLVRGTPARVMRPLTELELVHLKRSADNYFALSRLYLDRGAPLPETAG